ncbi:EAL domain-containing protein [Enterovibrio coralii]|uniref:Diguanylate phosphodiesterase n=1 Tax=Enterovibrio coralii TaxID=294935 RepID=A0A135I5H3_9GAMM|nr:EAL domain-containing protein [Enterovibrio coralii]KXF80683.1 hypothetical protein ATN88_08595 [Enterovibrio coralii]
MKVLIVEDDKIQATRLKMQLSHLSVSDIHFAEDGLEAIDVCRKFDIDLLFCDIQMPRMDGVSFLSKLNKISPDVGIVIFSSVEDAILKITFDMCNMAGFEFVRAIQKPISDSVLENIVLEHSSFMSKKNAHSSPQIQIGSRDVFDGFENDRFFCFYQPQFNLSNGNLSGVESLVRFSHPEYGVLGPHHFMDLIGDLGCKNQLFEIVLDKSVKLMASMSKELKLSVNFSQECLETDIYDLVIATCKKYDFPLNKLTLEMTEEDVYQCSIDSLANLARLRVSGVGLAIDDFGTGFASLSQLVQLPFTELKIDKAFLENIHSNYKNKQITEICLLLAHSLGLHCVVEGIENEEAYLFAKRIGIDTCQGYYTSKPIGAPDLYSLYQKHKCAELGNQFPQSKSLKSVYFDIDNQRSTPLVKLIKKHDELIDTIQVNTTDEVSTQLRDNAIQSLILESEGLSSTEISDVITHVKAFYHGPIFLLLPFYEEETDELKDEDNDILYIRKSRTVTETANAIYSAMTDTYESSSNLTTLFSKLSSREATVAKYILAGYTNKKISNELDISQKTVSTYKTRILSKLNINSMFELVKIFNTVN